MTWMILFGLVDAYILLWGGDVLYEYAMCGIFVFAFRTMKPRNLLLMSLLILSVTIYVSGSPFLDRKETYLEYKAAEKLLKENKALSEEQQTAYDGFKETLGTFLPFSKMQPATPMTPQSYGTSLRVLANSSSNVSGKKTSWCT